MDYMFQKDHYCVKVMELLVKLEIINMWYVRNPCREIVLNRFETCSLKPN